MAKTEIVNEHGFFFGSPDNSRNYEFEIDLSRAYNRSSVHGVIVDDVPVAVFGAGGGASGAHPNSLLEVGGRSYLAVGGFVVCFSTSPFQYHWALEIDPATCFGIYYSETAAALVSHGELEIARFDEAGRIIWSTSGSDIFSEGFRLCADFIEATDSDGRRYQFAYEDGHEIAQPSTPADACRRC